MSEFDEREAKQQAGVAYATEAARLGSDRYWSSRYGEVGLISPIPVGYSARGNAKVKVRPLAGADALQEVVVMAHDLITMEAHEAKVAEAEAKLAEEEAKEEREVAARKALVDRLGDDTSYLVKSDYQYSIANITGPYGWTEDQRKAVNEATRDLGDGYELPYDNSWSAYKGMELRELLEDIEERGGYIQDYALEVVDERFLPAQEA